MGRVRRKIIEIDEERCDGCGLCVTECAEGALQVVDGKARVVSESFCDGLGACIGACPQGALRIVEAEVEPFAEERLPGHGAPKGDAFLPCGCPSAQVQILARPSPAGAGDGPAGRGEAPPVSALNHWPVQIRLIPPHAPFLRGADLLVLADCTAVAYPALHRDFIRGKVVMMGCPKFDDLGGYEEKFAAVFKTAGIRRVTVVVMEVTCCCGLPVAVKRGMAAAGVSVLLEEVVLSLRGEIMTPFVERIAK